LTMHIPEYCKPVWIRGYIGRLHAPSFCVIGLLLWLLLISADEQVVIKDSSGVLDVNQGKIVLRYHGQICFAHPEH
jgi:hypothetical protein